ncbi:MAG: hypothetical protein JNK87_20620 [Bryobacterales bacterium]|nr:hypothetical protein [Bryobacterales bacterium]
MYKLLLSLVLAYPVAGQTPTLLKDIETGNRDSAPALLTAIGSQAFFTANDGFAGIELWKSDGTAAGTTLVKDILPGPAHSGVSNLTNVNGTLFFSTTAPGEGAELWKSDGTPAGTVLVKDIYPGPFSSSPRNLTSFNGILLFWADDGVNGVELWRSDGTLAGTYLVKDLSPISGMPPEKIAVVGSTLYFTSSTLLFRSDGTTAGTYLAMNLSTLGAGPMLGNLVNLGGALYFTIYGTPATTGALYQSDGTPAGTTLVKSFSSTSGQPLFGPFTMVAGPRIYFWGRDDANGIELWSSDGTTAGTGITKDITPGTGNTATFQHTAFNNQLFFVACTAAEGCEMWKTDGSAAGTMLVKETVVGSAGLNPSAIFVAATNSALFFTMAGGELWRTDGTAGGTFEVKDIRPGPLSSTPANLANINGALFFQANDGVVGAELWKSDGSAAGTVLVKNIFHASGNSFPRAFTKVGAMTYFAATDSVNGEELWKTDGTPAGTSLVADIRPGTAGSQIRNMVDFNGTLHFLAVNSTGNTHLYRSDGTALGTVAITQVYTGFGTSNGWLAVWNNKLYFQGESPGTGRELMVSDGTAAGTSLVADIYPGLDTSEVSFLTVFNNALYFRAASAFQDFELWKSDGTAAGTTRLLDINSNQPGGNPRHLTTFNGSLYFVATDAVSGEELWKSDGTAAGTVLVKDINPGAAGSDIQPADFVSQKIFTSGGLLYFRALTAAEGGELWRSDGTAAGTFLLKDIAAGNASAAPSAMAAAGPTVYFNARVSGNVNPQVHELWKTDGTVAGTVSVASIGASQISDLQSAGTDIYFVAATPVYGRELWKSDGTQGGTTRLSDIGPGDYGNNSHLSSVTKIGNTLYFAADDITNGIEPWMMPLAVAPPGITITFTSTPLGRTVLVDGLSYTTPASFSWQPLETHTVEAPDIVTYSGTPTYRHRFSHWDHGGARVQAITAPNTPTSYHARYNGEYLVTMNVSPPGAGTVSPGSGWYVENQLLSLTPTANAGFAFQSFSGAASGTSIPTSYTVGSSNVITANFTAVSPQFTVQVIGKSGTQISTHRTWTVRANNTGTAMAAGTQAEVSIAQVGGPACSPAVSLVNPPLYTLGNIAAGTNTTFGVSLNTSGCFTTSRFTLSVRFTAGTYQSNWLAIANQAP